MPQSPSRSKFAHLCAILLGGLSLLWPAVLSGYPLLYPDSMSYLGDGRPLAREIFLHRITGYVGMRSEIYSLALFFFHWNISAWPIVVLQALLASYVLWLVTRSIVPHRTLPGFLALIAALSILTSISWYACLIMPDILGPLVYLCIYLLVLARDTLSRIEKFLLSAIACWGIAAHTSHLMLAVILCALLTVLLVCRWQPMSGRGRALAMTAAVVVMAACSLLAIHAILYGKPTLGGNRPPYMMARIIADGPGAWYLQQHCATLDWAICENVAHLPNTDDAFLWDEGGVWAGSSHEKQQRLLREETPLVLASIRAYPRAQMQRSLANFWQEFTDFGLWDFCPNDWLVSEIDKVLPGTKARYLHTREQQGGLPNAFFTTVLIWTVWISIALIVVFLPLLLRRKRTRLLGLTALILPVIVANAFVTAVLSEPDSRYQSRLIWLIPCLAGLMILDALNHRHPAHQ